MDPKPDESTKLKAARAGRTLRVVVFWDRGSASRELLPDTELVIGRGDDCDIVVPDESVSRRHAIVRGGATPTIEDLDSANGTVVGERRIEARAPTPLAPSTVAELGDTLLVIRMSEAGDQLAPSIREPVAQLDAAMTRLHALVATIAPSMIPVIILGETGVGKSVIAEAIHRASTQASGPFVRINCAAFAETLLESELFGHERGAFTGASQSKQGLIEAANGGTLLLDEVGDMPLASQAKLLHALEHNEVQRVGSLKPRPIDVRFIAATNRDVLSDVSAGRFRQDLYFRLNGVSITVPPLRERPSELATLAALFVREASTRTGGAPVEITDAALALLAEHDWPGNVRELRNVMVRAALFARGGRIGVEHFELSSRDASARQAGPNVLRDQVRDLERRRIVEALARTNDNQVGAAKALGISRGTLRSRMKELGLLPTSSKPSKPVE